MYFGLLVLYLKNFDPSPYLLCERSGYIIVTTTTKGRFTCYCSPCKAVSLHLKHLTYLGATRFVSTSGLFRNSNRRSGDEDLEYLPEELHRLSLRACARVTDKALRKLPPTLRALDLSLCVKISNEGTSIVVHKTQTSNHSTFIYRIATASFGLAIS